MFRWRYWASIFLLLQAMEAFSVVDRTVYGEWEGKAGDNITQGLNLLVFVTSLLLFCSGFRRVRLISTGVILSIALAGFLLLTALWSISPEDTVRRAVVYLFQV